jgi:transposase
MPVRKEYSAEFKEQAVRFVFDEIGPDESRSAAVERLGPKLNVKPATLMNWVKAAAPGRPRPIPSAGSVEELRAEVAALKKENRELARANAILQDAASFFGAVLDRQSKR